MWSEFGHTIWCRSFRIELLCLYAYTLPLDLFFCKPFLACSYPIFNFPLLFIPTVHLHCLGNQCIIIISDGLKSLGWLDINQKLKFNDCVMMYKCLNESAPAYLSQRFKKCSQIYSRTTRNCNDLKLSKCRLATGQRSLSFRGAKIWNELPKSIRDATMLNTFKKNLLNLFKET